MLFDALFVENNHLQRLARTVKAEAFVQKESKSQG